MNAPVKFYLSVLSPLHLGCDDVLEPMTFAVDEAGNRLICFDPFDFLKSLPPAEKQQFAQLCKKGTLASILEIYKFMRSRSFPGPSIELCNGFVEHYRKVIGIPLQDTRRIQQELNSFTISRTAYNPNDGRRYIPGSSIKGMLRTAYLNMLAEDRKFATPRGREAARELEKSLLDGGSFQTDPFRMLKVSDFIPVGEVETQVLYAVNRKKVPSKFEARGPYQILESIKPGAVFSGWIDVQEPENGTGIRNPLDLPKLMASAKSFYGKELLRENRDLASIGARQIKFEAGDRTFPARLGRHSGAECVTIEGHRSIRIMRGRQQSPKYESNATTLWLAANSSNPNSNEFLLPFGWAALGVVSDQLAQKMAEREHQFQEKLESGAPFRPTVTSDQPIRQDRQQAQVSTRPEQVEVVREVWQAASLSWSPGNQMLTANWQGKKATVQGKELVPQSLHKKLFGKKKFAAADVEVEPLGNAYQIVSIAASQQ